MYYFITFLSGVALSAMTAVDGILSTKIGLLLVSFFVHGIGAILLIAYIKLIRKEKLKFKGLPLFLYSGGIMGLFLVVTFSYCIPYIGVAITTCVSILGQIIASAVIDHNGYFSVPIVKFKPKRVISLGIITLGLILLTI